MTALSAITLDRIKTTAPAVLTKTPAPDRSDRYQLVHTPDIIEAMEARGFVPTSVQQDRPTRRDPRFVRHMVRFAHVDTLGASRALGDITPQMLFWNSHNGRTMARMCAGFYRLVCLNGLVVGSDVDTYAFAHTGDIEAQIKRALEVMGETLTYGTERVERFHNVKLNKKNVISFAERAMALRFGANASSYDVKEIITPRREEDGGNVLWHVFNRVQENLTRGDIGGVNANGRRVRSRALTGITMDLEFNRGIWQLMEDYADAA